MKLSTEVLKTLVENGRVDYRNKNIIGNCPYCGGDEWGIALADNHKFGCFRKKQCGESGNIFKFLKKIGRLDLLSSPESVQINSNYVEDLITIKERLNLSIEEIKQPIGWRRVFENTYLRDRGFTDKDFQFYEVGITKLDPKLKDRIVFLIRQESRLVATVARTIKTKEEIRSIEESTEKKYPRYVNSKTDFESLLLGYDECTLNTKTVVLVEGIFGKRNIDEKLQLRDQEELKCLCTFGAKISDTQLYLLHKLGINNIILLYDPDVINYIKKYSSRLGDEFDSVRVGLITEQDKDPADLNEQEVISVFEKLQPVLSFQLNIVQVFDLK